MFEAITLKRLGCFGVLLLSLVLPMTSNAQESAAPTAAPDFALRSLDGSNLRLSEYRGSVVLLGFWARWCSDCRQAMQALNQVHAKYERAGLITLGIDVDDTEEQAAAMTRSLALTFPILIDTSKTASSQFDLRAMPLLVLIDREGRIRYSQTGFERGKELQLTEQLRRLLNE